LEYKRLKNSLYIKRYCRFRSGVDLVLHH